MLAEKMKMESEIKKYPDLRKNQKLETIKSKLTESLVLILSNDKNSFNSDEYKASCKLVNKIIHYPDLSCPERFFVRIGVLIDSGRNVQEYVIRFDNEILWLGMEGIERTGFGSDSYEKEVLSLWHENVINGSESLAEIEIEQIIEWQKDISELLLMDKCEITIENYE